MNYLKSLVTILVLALMFPLLSLAELNNAKNEDIQTLTFEIVSQNGSDGQVSLPKTGEKDEHLMLKGVSLISTTILVSVLLIKRGNRYD